MSTKKRLPTPVELAAFAREMCIPIENKTFFFEAVSEWQRWEHSIEKADAIIRNHDKRSSELCQILPLSEVMRCLDVRAQKTLRSWFEPSWNRDVEFRKCYPDHPGEPLGSFEHYSKNGFPKWIVEQLKEERDRRATERARNAAFAKAKKYGKKFKQEG